MLKEGGRVDVDDERRVVDEGRTGEEVRSEELVYAFNLPMTASGAYRGMTLGSC